LSEQVFVRQVTVDQLEKSILEILRDLDAGKYDVQLRSGGVTRPHNCKLLDGVDITAHGQGLSLNEWMQIVVIFGPTVATIAKDAWTIVVVPELKRVFRSDCVSPTDPKKRK
jgi:hypothetical protein